MDLEPFVFRRRAPMEASQATEPDADAAKAVNGFALRPLTPDEYAVFSLDLCHDQVDRHHSRFPTEELERISALTPGRPLMERHDLRGSLPRGTFFRSRVTAHSGRSVVRPDVYVLRTPENAGFILSIEGGVYRETSIGFAFRTPECSVCGKDLRTCDHVPGRSYSGEVCHYIMRDVLEVIEGSVVASGSQGTHFVSAASGVDDGSGRALPLDQALTVARNAYHRPIALETRRTWARE